MPPLEPANEAEAADLARIEAVLADLRRDPRAVLEPARREMRAMASSDGSTDRVKVAALCALGTAERVAGDAEAAQAALLDAMARSGPFLPERAKVLTSLGTVYVLLGAFGAARALLEHAAELHHQLGDLVGEAIAHGQLGAAALARSDLVLARKHFQRQEWLCNKVGDSFGRARSLVYLAEISADLGHPGDAIDLASLAITVASSSSPPLSQWIAYAKRTLGRALRELDPKAARADLEDARDRFAALDNRLGAALAAWDLSVLDKSPEQAFDALWSVASMGLAPRVAELLFEARGSERGPGDRALAAIAQMAPELLESLEVELLYQRPAVLSEVASLRTASQRNFARLAAFAIAPRGLIVAAIVADGATASEAIFPGERARAASIGSVPGLGLWAWPIATKSSVVLSDLAAAIRDDKARRAVVTVLPDAAILAPPFLGAFAPRLEGIDGAALFSAALALEPRHVRIDRALDFEGAANADSPQMRDPPRDDGSINSGVITWERS